MKIVRIESYKDFGLLATERGVDGYITNNDELLSGIPFPSPNRVKSTDGRFVLAPSVAQSVKLGPFVDEDDGKTIEDSLTIAQTDTLLSKNGSALTQKNDPLPAEYDAAGWYDIALNGTDTNTEGQLLVVVNAAGALPVWRFFEVKETLEI